jgi:hypothetical protein
MSQVKVSIAGAQLLPCRQLPEERTSLLQLPLMLGSVGAVTLAASSSQKPSEVKLGSKLLSMLLTVGQLEVSAAGQPPSGGRSSDAAASNASSGSKGAAAAVFVLPGITGSGHLANMPGTGSTSSSSRAASWAGRSSSSGLRSRQQGGSEQTQAQQQQQEEGAQHQQQQQSGQKKLLRATCTCQLKQQTQLQLHAARLPALLRAVQLLQLSLQELKVQRQAAAGSIAARQSDDSSPDEQLPENSLSPAVSLSSFPRAETPSLNTPCMSPSPRPTTEFEAPAAAAAAAQGSSIADAVAGAAAGAAAAVPGGSDEGVKLRGLATFRSGMLQRLPSRLLFIGGGADMQHADVGLMGELSVVTEAGVSVEVTDNKGEVSCWLSVQDIDAGAVAEWVPDVRSSSSSSSSRRSLLHTRRQQQVQGTLQLSAHTLLQQLSVSVAPCAVQAATAAAAGKPSQGCLPLHKLVQLDSASVQASSSEGEQSSPASAAEAAAAFLEKQPLPLQLSALAGQLQVAASVAALQPLLTLAEQLYQPTKGRPSVAGALPKSSSYTGAASHEQLSELSVFEAAVAAAAGALGQQKKPKVKRVEVTAVEVQLQGCELTLAHSLCASSAFATDAAQQAVAAGLQTQLLVVVSGVQLSVLPLQQQLGASLEVLQIGYKTQAPGAAAACQAQQQSVELLLLQAVHMRQYHADNLHLLKVAIQQIRSDNHIDAVLAGVNLASSVLQQGLSCVQQLGLRHASAGAATASQQAAAAAVAAAAAGDVQAAKNAVGVATAAAAALDEQGLYRGDSFSALAVQPILDGLAGPGVGTAASADTDANRSAQQQLSGPSAGAGLPPAAVRPGSSGSSARAAPRALKQKPLLALEARLCDVAVQLSVCDSDALMVQLQQVNYSSVLEQAVITDLLFAINERAVVRVPHAAVHDLPGWLPPGATAAAAGQARWAHSSSDGGGSAAGGHASSDDSHGVSAAAPHEGSDPAAAGESWQDHAAADAGDMTGTSFLNSPAPCSSLGGTRPLASADPALYSRQAARQAASRERCKAPASTAAGTAARSAADATGSAAAAARGGRSSISFSRSNDAAKAAHGGSDDTRAGGPGNEVISLDVYAERVLLSIPHDEAPGRIIVVCETWAKAVKEVRPKSRRVHVHAAEAFACCRLSVACMCAVP